MNMVDRIVNNLAKRGWIEYLLPFASLYKVELSREQIEAVLEGKFFNGVEESHLEDIFKKTPGTTYYLPLLLQVLAYHTYVEYSLKLVEYAEEQLRPTLHTIILMEVVEEEIVDCVTNVSRILTGQPTDLLERYLKICIDNVYPQEAQKAAQAIGRSLREDEISSLMINAFDSGGMCPSDFIFIAELRGTPLTRDEIKRFLQKCVEGNDPLGFEDAIDFIEQLKRVLSEEELAIIAPLLN